MTIIRYIFLAMVLFICVQNNSAQREAVTENELYLLNAVRAGNSDNVELGLRTNVSPNITDDYGMSLLMIAIKKKNLSIIDILIKSGANTNYRINKKGTYKEGQNITRLLLLQHLSVLDFAVNTEDTTIVNTILKAGAEINPKEEFLNPLKQASENKDYAMLVFLAGKGAKVSQKAGRDILALSVDRNINNYQKTPNELKEVIHFWDNQGIDISKENLLKSKFLNRRAAEYKIPRLITEYQTWLDEKSKNEKVIRSAAYANYIDPDYELKQKAREDSLLETIRERYERNQQIREAQQEAQLEKENTARMIFFYIISGILGILLFVFIKYGSLNRAVWDSIFQKLFRVQPNPNSNRNSNPKPKPKRNKNKPINPPKPRTKPKPQTPNPIAKPAIPSKQQSIYDKKGWITDNTKDIHVEFLTIEDMINPIRLRNEHEKAIRKMMWYMRRLENHTDEQIALVLGEEGLLPHLEALWRGITKTYVRDVYKRSLLLMVENYKTRDERVQSFIGRIKKRGNKPKKKSEKQVERNNTEE